MNHYSAKGGLFFKRNNGGPKNPTNAGTGGEQFYGKEASLSADNNAKVNPAHAPEKFYGKSASLSAKGEQ